MKTIPLSKGYSAIVDDEDFELVNQWKWTALDHGARIYAHRKIYGPKKKRTCVYLHRFLMNPPEGMEVDHADGNTLDNTRNNLRVCTVAQNRANRTPAKNKSGVTGVYYVERLKKWVVQVRNAHVGTFGTLEAASLARKLAEVAAFGEFAPSHRA